MEALDIETQNFDRNVTPVDTEILKTMQGMVWLIRTAHTGLFIPNITDPLLCRKEHWNWGC